MKSTLVPMREDAYASFLETSIIEYAAENVAAGRWLEEEALHNARAEFERLLPQGLATPGHFVHQVHDTKAGAIVGVLWFGVLERGSAKSAYVYQIRIDPACRRQGHARAAFEALEPIVAALGLPSIGLYVFSHNPDAQALYRSLGYAVTGINMRKVLSRSGGT